LNALSVFKILIVIQLLYAFTITSIAYTLPSDAKQYLQVFPQADLSQYSQVYEKTEESIHKQLNIPVIDLGALVFYTGNIVIDLLLNFITALPQMVTAVISVVFMHFNIDSYILAQLKLLITSLLTIIYLIMLIEFLVSMRTWVWIR